MYMYIHVHLLQYNVIYILRYNVMYIRTCTCMCVEPSITYTCTCICTVYARYNYHEAMYASQLIMNWFHIHVAHRSHSNQNTVGLHLIDYMCIHCIYMYMKEDTCSCSLDLSSRSTRTVLCLLSSLLLQPWLLHPPPPRYTHSVIVCTLYLNESEVCRDPVS